MNESQIDQVFHTLQNNCRSLQLDRNASLGDVFCEAVFDGYFCWPFTKAGELAVQPCSNDLLKSIKMVSRFDVGDLENMPTKLQVYL